MRHGVAALALAAVAGCFTDYEVGQPAVSGSSSTSGGANDATSGVDDTRTDDGSGEGSDGGGSGDGTSGGACEPAPPGMGSCPARCTGGCALGTCTIACHPRSICEDTDIVCPQGWPCVVLCDGEGACNQVTVHCSDGPCELQCSEPHSCEGLVLACGAQSCNAWCGEDVELEDVDCGPSCDCQSNCTSGESSESGDSGTTEGGSSD